jgi:tetratricopeptide (TPR) repeat protein
LKKILIFVVLLATSAIGSEPLDVWGTEAYNLEAGESFQFRINSDDIKLRNWTLEVDGDLAICDLHVLQMNSGNLLYAERNSSHHSIKIPWGIGEEISVVLTADSRNNGLFTVRFLGPPKDSAPAFYSYKVNRALDAYAGGRNSEAEDLCKEATRINPNDAEALVLLAGFYRDRNELLQARELIEQALVIGLSVQMEPLARQLLVQLNEMVGKSSTAELMIQQGKLLHSQGKHYQAVDKYLAGLTLTAPKSQRALIYYYMGELFADLGNTVQAIGAFELAIKDGLDDKLNHKALKKLGDLELVK